MDVDETLNLSNMLVLSKRQYIVHMRDTEDMAIIVEDLVRLLDTIGNDLRRGRYPSAAHGSTVAQMLRRVADDLDA